MLRHNDKMPALGWGLAAAIALATAAPSALADEVTHAVTHTFSVQDVQGGFDGSTYADTPDIICGLGVPCPIDGPVPGPDKSGIMLYPVDSEFGFYVSDFVGAATKIRDDDYLEGWVGDIFENNQLVGLRVSNVPTDTFKVPSNMGTWCAGLGGTSIKCSTEHGTNPALQDKTGRTAADFARRQAHDTLAALIETHAANRLEPVQREPHAGPADGS